MSRANRGQFASEDAIPLMVIGPSESDDLKEYDDSSDEGLYEYSREDESGAICPTDEQCKTLRRIAGSIPIVAYSMCMVEFAERASYYGCQFVFSNFIQFPLPDGGNGAGAPPKDTQETAGALGKGLAMSSALTLLFQFLAYSLPIFGGWWADVHLGRYKVICIGVAVCGVAHIVLVLGALPSVLQAGKGMLPFVFGLVTLAFGAGLFKANIAPIMLDQVTQQGLFIKVLKSGERVIVDPELTTGQLLMVFYGMINVGAFFGLATTYAEKKIGYWLAYSLPGVIYFLLPIMLVALHKKTIKKPAGGSDISNAAKIISVAFQKNKFQFWKQGFLDVAKPSLLATHGITTVNGKLIDWDDDFVEDIRLTIQACEIFLFFPFYYLNNGGIGNIIISQGASMSTDGVPNDLLNNFNPLTIIVAIPIINKGLYPFLSRHQINFGPIRRITLGFLLAAASSFIGGITQWRIYETSPCGYYSTDCKIGTGVSPISIWWQLPQYILGAISECFANVTAYQLAYSCSPEKMKGLVMSLFLFSSAISAVIQEICTPSLVDPYLVWPFMITGVGGTLLAVYFYYRYRHLDREEQRRVA